MTELSPQQKTLLVLKKLQAKVDALEHARTEPIAIVGAACRFPGADDPDAFWEVLRAGTDTVREVPADRWAIDAVYDPDPDALGKTYTRSAAFLERVDQFDARFFGISRREASRMDPQQRLLVEVAWEAFERAGLSAAHLAGSRTGVYVGIGVNDYALLGETDPASIDAYSGTGNGFCFAAGRLSYLLGLHGPSLSLDTACSSSLVAIHLACQSLRAGECNLALAAGVQLLLSPLPFVFLSRARALAPDGRCKTFDASADGYSRGEGCAVVVLKRLSDAVADRDHVLAVVRGSAVNHDGASSGFTVPNGLAQQKVIRDALVSANVAPADIAYVEAHGTGTSLGDPIEIDALAATLGTGRAPERPLLVGSVKTNIGHLEAAAGIAGVLKVALALQHDSIPAHLHFRTPNPLIDWARLPVRVTAEATPWPSGRRLAGVSSFGLSGTNAHVILEAAPARTDAESPAVARPLHIVTLSAKSPEALSELTARYASAFEALEPLEPHAADEAGSVADAAFTTHVGRTAMPHRAAVVGATGAELARKLRDESVLRGTAGQERPRIAFLFTGQGAQYAGMGRELYDTEPVFRATIDRCDEVLAPLLPVRLASVLYPSDGEPSPIDETLYTQPALFAIEMALAELWRSWGVSPYAVMGHSVGEIAAACAVGLLGLEDGLRLVVERARLMQSLPAGGAMATVFASEAHLVEVLAKHPAVALAAANGPLENVVSGPASDVAAVCAAMEEASIKTRPLVVSHAFHSPLVEPILDAFEGVARGMTFGTPRARVISNVTGALADATELGTAAYWRRHVREPVRFAAGMKALASLGIDLFIEIGPRPVLLGMGRKCLPESEAAWLPSLREKRGTKEILASLATAWTRGCDIDWPSFHGGNSRRRVVLPTYPFQRQRYWIREEAEPRVFAGSNEHGAPAPLRQDAEARDALSEQLLPLSPPRRRARLAALVESHVAHVLGEGRGAIDPALGFFDLGMDSLMSVELRKRLERALGRPLPTTLAFDYPRIDSLARYLDDLLSGTASPAGVPVRVARHGEPIAILGMACRFPGGANDPDAYWQLVQQGTDATSEVPRDRWDIDAYYDPDPDAPGKMYVRRGGFLQGVPIDMFDAAFFGISPREAATMDPQQRMLLEVAWEALESAGQVADRLGDSRTAVMVGVASNDYAALLAASETARSDTYAMTGNAFSCTAGRLSFTLGLQGPCMPVDTACSSSIVAVHLACQALSNGEADLALAGGVNLMLAPMATGFFSRLRALAPDGRCKTFDASADGYVRGEGCGVIVLKRLADAQRDGDPILALVRGSAVNHDGRTSGLTVPNGPAQTAVIREALAVAGVPARRIGYLEAHGTGTPLGDPIEVQAAAIAFGDGRPPSIPLVLGSAKANIGHLEAAAGIAGVIRTVQMLRHAEIPPLVHFATPNPDIPWDRLPVVVPTALVPWPAGDETRMAGISSFGMSGTNAHVILEEAPRPDAASESSDAGAHLLTFSARSPEALRELATAYRAWLRRGASPLSDLCYTAAVRRSHHAHRVAIVGEAPEGLVGRLDAFLTGLAGPAPAKPRKLVFVFSGHNSQWLGMARGLLDDEPIFRRAIEACAAAIRTYAPFDVVDVLRSDVDRYDDMSVTQPVLFAVQVALAELFRAYGVEPDAVIGHSMGEISAAHVAGVLGLADAARIICARSRLLERAGRASDGAMVAVELSLDEARALLVGLEDRVSIAAANGPRAVVLSGDPVALDGIASRLTAENVFCRRLRVGVAAHSPQLDSVLPELLAELEGIAPEAPRIVLQSTAIVGYDPAERDGLAFGPEYWAKNLRTSVLFWPAVERLLAEGYDAFLELSPHPLLVNPIEQGAQGLGRPALAVASLRRREPGANEGVPLREGTEIREAIAALHAGGAIVDLIRLYPKGNTVPTPAYPWQRKRHWLPAGGEATAAETSQRLHPLLGARVQAARPPHEHIFDVDPDAHALPFLREQLAFGLPIAPSAAFVEAILAGASDVLRDRMVLESFTFVAPLEVPEAGRLAAQLVLTPFQDGFDAAIYSGVSPEPACTARVVRAVPEKQEEPAPPLALPAVRARCRDEVAGDDVLANLAERGLALRGGYQALERVWRGDGEVLGRIRIPESRAAEAGLFRIDPPVLELALLLFGLASDTVLLPASIERLRAFGRLGASAWVHAKGREDGTVDVRIVDDGGRSLVEAAGVSLRPADRALLRRAAQSHLSDWLYELTWEKKPHAPAGAQAPGRWIVLEDAGGAGDTLARTLAERGERVVRVRPGARAALGEGRFTIDAGAKDDVAWLIAETEALGPLRGVAHLFSLDAPATEALDLASLEAAQRLGARSIPPIVQALAAAKAGAKLWIVTRGAEPVDGEGPGETLAIAQSPIWGIGRTVALEHPELWGGLIDLDPRAALDGPRLADELTAPDLEDHIAYRGGERLVARLVRARAEASAPAIRVRDDAMYMVTGGLRGLGLEVARWLVDSGARHVVLIGRQGLYPDAVPAVRAMEALGATIHAVAGDVADAARMAEIFAEVARWGPPLAGVIHAAGTSRPKLLLETEPETVDFLFGPKVTGSFVLDRLTRGLPLDFFVLFSSAAATWGGGLLGAYGAANHFLDATAHARRRRGETAVSINWGGWEGGTMMASMTDEVKGYLRELGFEMIPNAQALEVLGSFLGSNAAQRTVAAIDWSKFKPIFEARRRRPLLDRIEVRKTDPREGKAAPAAADLVRRLAAASPGKERLELLMPHVRIRVAEVLGLEDGASLSPEQGFFQLGMDSIMSVRLRQRLESDLGMALPPTVAFEHPTLVKLATYITGTLAADRAAEVAAPIQPARRVAEPSPVERTHAEPIAILGLACRFPGADSPEAFWRLLAGGIDATADVPADRWDADTWYDPDPDAPAKMYTRRGGFVGDVDRFDARLFGINPREAVSIDPQHRFVWELAWEALERAGRAPDGLAGSRTGVYVGISNNDYAHLQAALRDVADLDGFMASGNALNFAAGRLSYMLGLQGPAMAVDTACSSSLVAVHLACQGLRHGETDLAVAAGVNLMLHPATNIVLSKARMLAPDGRCKTFDEAADGYGRGEGCGVIVLSRLADALAAGDPVLAVIRGSAVNQDGPSSGPTVPNGHAQKAVIREALVRAGVSPGDVSYIEAHGTGTSLGDPIELRALGSALAEGRPPGRRFAVGSVKTNIGHLESAAGIAGLIKVVLSLQHRELPAHLHLRRPNPNIPWNELAAVVRTELTPWAAEHGPRIAGVSSFGASGTNAHVVLGEAPERAPAPPSALAERPFHVLFLSARRADALPVLAARYEAHLAEHPRIALEDVAHTAATGRAALPHRLAIVAPDAAAAREKLAGFAANGDGAGVFTGRARAERPRIAFLFTGQGSQFAGMGRELYESEPVFREALDRCMAVLDPLLSQPLRDVLFSDSPALHETGMTQPAMFAFEIALAELWRSFGVQPDVVLGHSVGELAAACVAGVFSLEDGLALIAERGRLMQGLPPGGEMAAVFASEASIRDVLARHPTVGIAAINGPTETVLSGDAEALAAVLEGLAAANIKARTLQVSHAFHSVRMDPILDAFEARAAAIALAAPRTKLVSNLTGRLAGAEIAEPAYWRRHVREPVRFEESIGQLRELGIDTFVEIGPKPTLLGMVRRCLPEGGTFLPSLRENEPAHATLWASLAQLWIHGAPIDVHGVHPRGTAGRTRLVLPTYPFHRERHWIEPSRTRHVPVAAGVAARSGPPLLGRRVASPIATAFELELDPRAQAIFRDHRVHGRIVVSGVVHLSMAMSAAAAIHGTPDRGVSVEAIAFSEPLLLSENEPLTVQSVLGEPKQGVASFQLHSLDAREPGAWRMHTSANIRLDDPSPIAPWSDVTPDALRARLSETMTGEDFYRNHWKDEEHYIGPSFRLVERIWRGDGEAFAEIRVPARTHEIDANVIELAIAEACGQVTRAAMPGRGATNGTNGTNGTAAGVHLAVGLDRYRAVPPRGTDSQPETRRFCHVRLRAGHDHGDTLVGDARVLDEHGRLVSVSEGLRFQRVPPEVLRHAVGRRRIAKRAPGLRRETVLATPEREREAQVLAYVLGLAASVSGLPPSDIDAEASIRDLGLDSLRAVELRGWFEQDLAIDLPVVELIEGPSPRRLAARILSLLSPSHAAPPPKSASTVWLRREPRPDPACRLFCFPFGGGGASIYHGWQNELPSNIEVCAVQLPGREDRVKEPAHRKLGDMLDALEPILLPLLDRPFAFFGVSMGVIVHFELARRLRTRYGLEPARLFVASAAAPDRRPSREVRDMVGSLEPGLLARVGKLGERLGRIRRDGAPMRDLARSLRDDLLSPNIDERVLRRYDLVPEALLSEPAFVDALLPLMQADLDIVRGYRFRRQPPFACPISALGGQRDRLVREIDLAGWARQTRGAFAVHMFPGPHLFVRTDRTAVLQAVASDLHAVL